jgi:hypothetical protein
MLIAGGAVAGAVVTGAIVDAVKHSNIETPTEDVIELTGLNREIPKGHELKEHSNSRTLSYSFSERAIIKDTSKNKVQAIYCPDYSVNQAYYNQIFTGAEHLIRTSKS